jgi:hypothetical protein
MRVGKVVVHSDWTVIRIYDRTSAFGRVNPDPLDNALTGKLVDLARLKRRKRIRSSPLHDEELVYVRVIEVI